MKANTQYRQRSTSAVPPCPYNIGVECNTPLECRCSQCGWNPAVAAQRIAEIRKARQKPEPKFWTYEFPEVHKHG